MHWRFRILQAIDGCATRSGNAGSCALSLGALGYEKWLTGPVGVRVGFVSGRNAQPPLCGEPLRRSSVGLPSRRLRTCSWKGASELAGRKRKQACAVHIDAAPSRGTALECGSLLPLFFGELAPQPSGYAPNPMWTPPTHHDTLEHRHPCRQCPCTPGWRRSLGDVA